MSPRRKDRCPGRRTATISEPMCEHFRHFLEICQLHVMCGSSLSGPDCMPVPYGRPMKEGVMGQGVTTSSERLKRWQALLSGTDGNGVRARALCRSGEVNLLTGVWLHAAARAEEGLELTELERSLLAPVEELLGAAEVCAVGRVPRAGRQGRSGGAGASVGGLPQPAGRFRPGGVLGRAGRVAPADHGPAERGRGGSGPSRRRRGLAHPGVHRRDGRSRVRRHRLREQRGPRPLRRHPDDPPFRAALEWGAFQCFEPWGDQWGTKDEIYWTAVSKAATYEHTTRTAETKSVEEGGY